ncbi:MAG: cupin domain-containing protein [Actinomycetota bacterium]|nr:cupin domain-containing protein [Actinomycetota bacterium]
MDVGRVVEGPFEHGDDRRFTGEVWLKSTIAAPNGKVGIVHFSPGARTHWHRHPGGQFLYGVSGSGRMRTRGESGHEPVPGDVIYVGSDEWHFHGGGPQTPMVHVTVNGGGTTEWGERIKDDEYSEASDLLNAQSPVTNFGLRTGLLPTSRGASMNRSTPSVFSIERCGTVDLVVAADPGKRADPTAMALPGMRIAASTAPTTSSPLNPLMAALLRMSPD